MAMAPRGRGQRILDRRLEPRFGRLYGRYPARALTALQNHRRRRRLSLVNEQYNQLAAAGCSAVVRTGAASARTARAPQIEGTTDLQSRIFQPLRDPGVGFIAAAT